MPLTDFTFDLNHRSNRDNYDPELWRTLYGLKFRYLEDLSPTQLDERYAQILRNKASFSSREHEALRPHNLPNSFWFWVRREEEIEEEYKLRGLPLPAVVLGVPPLIRSLMTPVLRGSPIANSFVARFAKRKRLRDSFERGKFRLNHARTFNDTGLNDAQKDNELTASVHSPSRVVTIQLPNGQTLKPTSAVTYSRTNRGNTYILCAGTEFDPWLFHYFEADACLVVDAVDEFLRRLDVAFAAQAPGFISAAFGVGYIDPHNANAWLGKHDDAKVVPDYRPLLTKSLKYAYQKEFRFVWSFNHTSTMPDYFDIEAGSLRDIARYYEFDTNSGALVQIA